MTSGGGPMNTSPALVQASGKSGVSYDRLVKLKNRYDPKNLFRMNANVKPSV